MHTTTWRLVLVLSVAAVAVGTAACGNKQVKLTMADNGKQVSVNSGETFTIALEANPTTGYSWSVIEGTGLILEQQGEPTYTPASTTAVAGGGGIQTFLFKATNSGAATLTLGYGRPWEKGVPPVKTFSVKVVVR
jgi:inhibitor of cysteine peptidase